MSTQADSNLSLRFFWIVQSHSIASCHHKVWNKADMTWQCHPCTLIVNDRKCQNVFVRSSWHLFNALVTCSSTGVNYLSHNKTFPVFLQPVKNLKEQQRTLGVWINYFESSNLTAHVGKRYWWGKPAFLWAFFLPFKGPISSQNHFFDL